jgi:hypothetical protein
MSAGGTGRWDDDKLERDEGVLIRDDTSSAEGCDEETDRCAPDEVVEDPVDDRHVPGTYGRDSQRRTIVCSRLGPTAIIATGTSARSSMNPM